PRIVNDVVREIDLTEARQIDGKPWNLQSESDLEVFESVLLDAECQLPVLLLRDRGWALLGDTKVCSLTNDELKFSRCYVNRSKSLPVPGDLRGERANPCHLEIDCGSMKKIQSHAKLANLTVNTVAPLGGSFQTRVAQSIHIGGDRV